MLRMLTAWTLLAFFVSPAAQAKCLIAKIAELPVTMTDMKAMVTVNINGIPAVLAADSGAFYSIITPATATQYNLKTYPAPYGLHMSGIGGETEIALTRVKKFTLAGVDIPNVEFLVGGGESGGGSVGLLGQNVFSIADVEYDLAKGVIKLVKEQDCKKVSLAYWAVDGQAISEMEIQRTSPLQPGSIGDAFINGTKVRVMFDSGSDSSMLTRRAAERAGIQIDGAGVQSAGYVRGVGRVQVRTWIAPVASFKIGDEEIRNTRLRVSDASLASVDMLLGADFFLAHHIYVASKQNRLYFTYNGGNVFRLESRSQPSAAPAAGGAAPAGDEPTDAPSFARRAAAFASRHELPRAIADFTKACELDPTQPDFFYERGMAHWQNNEGDLALGDFDRALTLKADDVPALVARAELRLSRKESAPALEDLDAAERFAAKEADVRLRLSQDYFRLDHLAQAVAQSDLWITAHAADSRLPQAQGERCAERAWSGERLDRALDDCNTALRRLDSNDPRQAALLSMRGLVRLRLGDYGKAIADYDAALKIRGNDAVALYGRGIAKRRAGKSGESDLNAAVAQAPGVPVRFERHGMTP
jgi:tetratricopeptide (TPR) repeat protein/predicted aspartyl protease